MRHVVENENAPFPADVVVKTWLKAINDRLEMDCLMMNSSFRKKALKHSIVKSTWTGTLKNEAQLPSDWTGVARVLVGIGL